jgi:hypothetical protein
VYFSELEADDLVSYFSYTSDQSTIICSPDKDVLKQCVGMHYNYGKAEFVHTSPEEALAFLWVQALMGDSTDNIVELANFMTAEEQSILYEFAKNNKNWDYTETIIDDDGVVIYDASYWEDRVASSTTLYRYSREIYDLIQILQKRLKTEVDKFFKIDAFATGPTVVK